MAVAVKKEESRQEEGTPQTFEEALAPALPQVQQTLKAIPPEKLAEAKKEVDRLLQGDLSWTDLSKYPPEQLLKIAELGYGQFKIGQYDKAERIFKGLTVIDPENYYYHQLLGATFQRKNRFPEAVVEYSVAADLNPKDVVSLGNRGEAYFKMGIVELPNNDFHYTTHLNTKK